MDNFFSNPLSLRQRASMEYSPLPPLMAMQDYGIVNMMKRPHESHPDFLHLMLLVFEAVLEVVFVALPGYIVARMGMFDIEAQKLVANLNIYIFTPCLIFTKLGSQLNARKLYELAIIPLIFLTQTLVSWLCAYLVSKAFKFGKRPSNFVTAMAVFGNSNSLPISLILSLSQTISGLHWSRIEGDNDDEVGARGILYLLIFQQLGQLVRWTWGYNVLLKSKEEYEQEAEAPPIPPPADEPLTLDVEAANQYDEEPSVQTGLLGDQTPITYNTTAHTPVVVSSSSSSSSLHPGYDGSHGYIKGMPNIEGNESHDSLLTSFPGPQQGPRPLQARVKSYKRRTKSAFQKSVKRNVRKAKKTGVKILNSLPKPIRYILVVTWRIVAAFVSKVLSAMNPPLWAMLAAVLVATVPALQHLFFDQGTFVNNSVTHAVNQTGQVAVPLILVVLGANLGRGTKNTEVEDDDEDSNIETRLLVASLFARMLLPIVFMGPILALVAKYVPISILDDPIFVIVCFLLTGAPSALQLAQICQTKNVYMGAMSKVLFQSYVVWIFPSTMVLVLCALEVVEWAKAS